MALPTTCTIMIDGKTYVVPNTSQTFAQIVTATGISSATGQLTFTQSTKQRSKMTVVSGESITLADGDALTSITTPQMPQLPGT